MIITNYSSQHYACPHRAAQRVDGPSHRHQVLALVQVHGLEQVVVRHAVLAQRLGEPGGFGVIPS